MEAEADLGRAAHQASMGGRWSFKGMIAIDEPMRGMTGIAQERDSGHIAMAPGQRGLRRSPRQGVRNLTHLDVASRAAWPTMPARWRRRSR